MAVSTYKVRVTKDYLVFCSGHFITYAGGECERIHGHNYRVAVEVEDDLDENHYVFDFIALKNLTQTLTDELDHRMMLPLRSRLISVRDEGTQVEVRYGERRWSFPKDDCVLLPLENTTAELLARHLAERLRQSLAEKSNWRPAVLRVKSRKAQGSRRSAN